MTNSKNGKILILYNSVPYFLRCFDRDNVKANYILNDINICLRIVRKFSRWLKFSQVFWFGKWKNEIKDFETVIIFAPLSELEVIRYIKANNNNNIRIIYWYWNPICRVGKLDDRILEDVELWSFDPYDCMKYDLNFNTTFYFKDISLPDSKLLFDTIFVGNDKGRATYLKELETKLRKLGLKTYFHIVTSGNQEKKNLKKIPYDQYLQLLSNSKVIIDIVPKGQSGLTLRPMESIFLEKKLITTDTTIADQDFYNPSNVFIIGIDNEEDLTKFINSPFTPVNTLLLEKYDSVGWLKRFK